MQDLQEGGLELRVRSSEGGVGSYQGDVGGGRKMKGRKIFLLGCWLGLMILFCCRRCGRGGLLTVDSSLATVRRGASWSAAQRAALLRARGWFSFPRQHHEAEGFWVRRPMLSGEDKMMKDKMMAREWEVGRA